MRAIYNSKCYKCAFGKQAGSVVLYSYTKDKGFQNHVDPWGNEATNFFSMQIFENQLDYLYELRYEVNYKNHYFNLNSVINPQTIQEDFYSITLDFLNEAEQKLAEELDFERADKFYYEKHIHRSDIEALKVIEIPLGIFALQGTQERILEGQEIDDYLDSIVG